MTAMEEKWDLECYRRMFESTAEPKLTTQEKEARGQKGGNQGKRTVDREARGEP